MLEKQENPSFRNLILLCIQAAKDILGFLSYEITTW